MVEGFAFKKDGNKKIHIVSYRTDHTYSLCGRVFFDNNNPKIKKVCSFRPLRDIIKSYVNVCQKCFEAANSLIESEEVWLVK